MWMGILGLVAVICAVSWQVFGRYVLNNTPTWAESLALLLVIYVTMLGVAVGVRDAGHIGLESLLVLAPDWLRLKMEFMRWSCCSAPPWPGIAATWLSPSGVTACQPSGFPRAGNMCLPLLQASLS
jgi:TRAP-type C4-dicarboxylate transport system permease small subunit